MKSNFIYIFFICLLINLFNMQGISAKELFNFNVSEIEIKENGNIVKGYNGGEAFTNDGIYIKAQDFEYNKVSKTLISKGNVIFKDKNNNITMSADQILYLKTLEKVIADGSVKIKDINKNITIDADKTTYFKNQEKVIADGSVKIKDINKNITIDADKTTYFKNQEKVIADGSVKIKDVNKNITINTKKIKYLKKINKISTNGETILFLDSKYKFNSKNITFLQDEMRLYSSHKTTINDNNFSFYSLSSFDYQIENEFLKGTDVFIIENSNLPKGESDEYFFENGFFDLKNQNFKTGEVKIKLKKNIFGKTDNDPRIYGTSLSKKDGISSIKKAVFTSCKKTDSCPPWRLEASEIKHDKEKKQLIYDDTVLKLYDIPVFYFPKFFHPDPTVKRQSGFLQPRLNSSNILGSSLSIPYFHVLSENKDLTFNPILFSKDIKMIQNEYRQKNERSSLILDFGITNGFKSSATQKKKNINHLFARFEKDLKLESFFQSDFNIFTERVTKDTYLKIFGDSLSKSDIKPKNFDILNSGFDIFLENEKFSLSGGTNIYEDLTKNHSDRYQFVFPYYNFSKSLIKTDYGHFNIYSKGNNTLDNTNNVKSRIINDFNFKTNDKIFENLGLKNNFNIYFKNLNSVGKNVSTYKSSPQLELLSLIELNSELPLIKTNENHNNILIPRLSLRVNPSDMKDYSSSERKINMDNIFDINRLGINDTFETGNSLTLGIDFKKENKKNKENYLELKLGSVFRDNTENNIPSQTTLNKKNSNLFGSIDYAISEFVNLDYNFAIDNKIESFEYNSIGLGLSLNNFITKFNFIEEDSVLGNTNVFENVSKFDFNKENSISFKTRRNREINLTEYYDLIYEYKNDCLTAGVRFNKTYYEDRDLKPTKNLMFTISFFPLTSVEQSLK